MARFDATRTQNCGRGSSCRDDEPIPLAAAQLGRLNRQLTLAVGSDLRLAKATTVALARLAELGDLAVTVQVLELMAALGPRDAVRPVVDLLSAQPRMTIVLNEDEADTGNFRKIEDF